MSDLTKAQLLGWAKTENPVNPAQRLCYGGVTNDGRTYYRTTKGETFSMPLNTTQEGKN